ncbi:MAG: tetratricopeptide repeat protein, partial [Promethearchaeota archaeon]
MIRLSMGKEIEGAYDLMLEGEFDKVFQVLADFEKLTDINPDDKHYYRFLKVIMILIEGRIQESLKIVEEDYQECKSRNKSLFLIDAILLKFSLFMLINRFREIWEDVEYCEILLKSISNESPSEVRLREGFFYYMKGYLHYWVQEFDQAIELHRKSLTIIDEYNIALPFRFYILNVLGLSYTEKGELDLALEFHKKALDNFEIPLKPTDISLFLA